jgi:hypothetical protein
VSGLHKITPTSLHLLLLFGHYEQYLESLVIIYLNSDVAMMSDIPAPHIVLGYLVARDVASATAGLSIRRSPFLDYWRGFFEKKNYWRGGALYLYLDRSMCMQYAHI